MRKYHLFLQKIKMKIDKIVKIFIIKSYTTFNFVTHFCKNIVEKFAQVLVR